MLDPFGHKRQNPLVLKVGCVLVLAGILMSLRSGGSWALSGPDLADLDPCAVEIQAWAEALTARLPLFANLERARLQTAFRVVLVGIPEWEVLDQEQKLLLGAAAEDQVVRLYFSTLERQITIGSPQAGDPNPLAGRRSDQLRLAYRAYVVRRSDVDPWRLFTLEILAPGIPVRDISEGGMAQAIRRWQQTGCPS